MVPLTGDIKKRLKLDAQMAKAAISQDAQPTRAFRIRRLRRLTKAN